MGAPPGVTPDEPAPNVDAGGAAAPMSCTPGAPAPDCAEVVCPGDDVCRDFPALVAAGTCTAEARCASVADCAPVWYESSAEAASLIPHPPWAMPAPMRCWPARMPSLYM